jgi:hypothetical protein
MPPVRIQRADRKLITQEVEIAGDEIKQGTDPGVGLSVVISQMAFVVALECGDTPVRKQLPVIARTPWRPSIKTLTELGKAVENSDMSALPPPV